ncbi:NUDIX hydrolase [Streptomyces sp. NPDC057298]|uniref:NUDIX hydrolase n=1 Tax=Streptomyces sp. NPDC057298 TaxID=3346091 RepID=UPI003632E0AC
MPACDPSFTIADDVEVPSPSPGELWTVGAVILNRAGEAFAQKRSPDRRLFPDTWDIVGGHVEAGESILEALAREVEEETGWRLRHVRQFLGTRGGAHARATAKDHCETTPAAPIRFQAGTGLQGYGDSHTRDNRRGLRL